MKQIFYSNDELRILASRDENKYQIQYLCTFTNNWNNTFKFSIKNKRPSYIIDTSTANISDRAKLFVKSFIKELYK